MKKALFIMSIMSLGNIQAVFQTISQAGLYQVGEDITYNPSVTNDVIFQITASNVVLDLGNHTITQGNATTGLVVVQVNSGLSNVIIRNGTIRSIHGTGVQVLNNCARIIVDNITTLACDTRGIDFVGSSGNTITDSKVRNCSVIQCATSSSSTAAVALTFCKRMVVESLYAGSNGTTNHNISTVSVTSSDKCHFKNMIIENTTGNTTLRGILFTSATNCWLSSCIVDSTFSMGNNPSCSGYELDTASTNNIFVGCISSQATALSGTAATVNGFLINGADNFFVNCYARNGNGEFTRGFSVGAVGNRTTFINCVGSNNNSTVNTSCGFRSLAATALCYIRCKALNQVSTPNAGVGFELQGTTESLVNKCTAYRNTGVNASNSIGYRQLSGATNITAVNNLSTLSATPYSGFAAGAINSVAATTVNSTTIGAWTNLGTT